MTDSLKPLKKLVRNMKDPASRAYWEETKRIAARVASWPGWMRGSVLEPPRQRSAPLGMQVKDQPMADAVALVDAAVARYGHDHSSVPASANKDDVFWSAAEAMMGLDEESRHRVLFQLADLFEFDIAKREPKTEEETETT